MNTPAYETAYKVAGSYFMSSKNDNVVHSIRLINPINEPVPNFDYPYQIILFWYNPGFAYYADTQTLKGGIAIDGSIQFSTWTGGFYGRLIDDNTIAWNDGSFWKRIDLPPLQTYNPYTSGMVRQQDVNATKWLSSRTEKAYPYQPGCQGL